MGGGGTEKGGKEGGRNACYRVGKKYFFLPMTLSGIYYIFYKNVRPSDNSFSSCLADGGIVEYKCEGGVEEDGRELTSHRQI